MAESKFVYPDKLYARTKDNKTLDISYAPQTLEAVEYTRTEAFIEKACDYINEHIEYYIKKDKACNVPLCPQFATKSFLDNFRKYMEGE